jgi:hypothetical protein
VQTADGQEVIGIHVVADDLALGLDALDADLRIAQASASMAGCGSPPDSDGDRIPDGDDICPAVPDPHQRDNDADGLGDACDGDDDNDGVPDAGLDADNCPFSPNPLQTDTDGDGAGDRCDGDTDGDGVTDAQDNCPASPNSAQDDSAARKSSASANGWPRWTWAW